MPENLSFDELARRETEASNQLGMKIMLVVAAFIIGILVGRFYGSPVSDTPQPEIPRLAQETVRLINEARSGKGFGLVTGRGVVYADLDGTFYYRYNSTQLDTIPPHRLIWFTSAKEAEAHGYKPY